MELAFWSRKKKDDEDSASFMDRISGDSLSVGNYVMVWKQKSTGIDFLDSVFDKIDDFIIDKLSGLVEGKELDVGITDKTVIYHGYEFDGEFLNMFIEVRKNPVPIAAVISAIGVTGIFLVLTLVEIRKIFEGSKLLFTLGGIAAVLFGIGYIMAKR